MERLDGIGSPAYCKSMLFVVNTASIQLLPTTVIALRAQYNSAAPYDILLPVLVSGRRGADPRDPRGQTRVREKQDMNLFVYLIPALFVVVFIVAAIRKVKVYDSFAEGVKGAIPLVVSLFPFVAAVLILSQLFEASGLSDGLQSLLAPVLSAGRRAGGNRKTRAGQAFSGSGATALLSEIFQKYGADSYIARCAASRNGSSETVFYVAAVYLRFGQGKKLAAPHRHSPMRQLHRARVRLFPMPFFLAGRKC